MNQYEQIARRQWSDFMPERMEELIAAGTVDEFFHDLGVQCESQIEQLRDQMWAQLPKDLDDRDRVGQMRMIVKQAEERVLYDLIYAPVGQHLDDPGNQDLEELMLGFPAASSLRQSRYRFMDQKEDEAEQMGWKTPMLSEQEAEDLAIWDRLIEVSETWEKTETITPEMEAFARKWMREQNAL